MRRYREIRNRNTYLKEVMAKGLLRSGAKPAPGGARKGAGRKPDWFKSECARILDKHNLLEFIGRVAAGIESEQHLDKEGVIYELRPKISDRIKATEFLSDRANGKPTQALELGGEGGGPLTVQIVNYSK
jgi:hypothetical protein